MSGGQHPGPVPGRAGARGAPRRRALAIAGVLAAVLAIAACAATNPYFDPTRPHHRASGFTNNYGPAGGKPLGQLLAWFWERTWAGLPAPPSRHFDGYGAIPVEQPDRAYLNANRACPSVTWIGHATTLLQLGGLNVLTDPQFSERAFPFQWMGPKRRVAPAIRAAELPRIDLVVISHNHYDHLDRDSVLALNAQRGGPPLFLVPLGVEAWMRAQGIERVEALDWWSTRQVGPVDVHFVPAQHWSARTPFDRNETLWGGWVLRTPGFSAYFAGDTGYSPDFADIGRRFGGFDVALIPVGAYLPRWFMKDQHVDPAEAVRIHRDVGSRLSIGIHWGTFELTDEPLDAPIGELASALAAAGVAPEHFVLLRHGQTRRFDAQCRALAHASQVRDPLQHGHAVATDGDRVAVEGDVHAPAASERGALGRDVRRSAPARG